MLTTLVLTAVLLQPSPLEGEWTVDVVDNIKVVPEAPITISVRGTRVSGNASCNSYSGGITIADDAIKTDHILTTMKACDGVRMGQERDFLALLRTVTRFELQPKDVLVLTAANGKTMTARRRVPSSR